MPRFSMAFLHRRHGRSLFIGATVLLVLTLVGLTGRPAPESAPVSSAPITYSFEAFPLIPIDAPAENVGTDYSPPAGIRATPPAVVIPSGQDDPDPPPPPDPGTPYFDTHRIVSYYGHPWARGMGIVGEYDPTELVRRLRAQAATYQALDPDKEVVPAIHLIFAVAQGSPGSDGLYLGRMDPDLVKSWIQITKDNGLLLFLDVQFGRSTVDRELPLVLPYLAEPNVHLALDPEFKWSANQFPNVDLGHLDGSEINRAQDLMQKFMAEHDIKQKILIVHQFRRDMITNKDTIKPHDGIDFVLDADGFGPPETKIGAYNSVVRDDGIQYGGFKLFYHHDADSGRLMREDEVLGLQPPPVVIIYQ